MQKEYKQKINITLDKEIKQYLKIKAVKENTSVSNLITKIAKKMMEEDKVKK